MPGADVETAAPSAYTLRHRQPPALILGYAGVPARPIREGLRKLQRAMLESLTGTYRMASGSTPLTLEEHRELGREIGTVTARIHELSLLVNSVYGPNNQAAFTFQKVAQELERLCGDLQAQARQDLPGFVVEDLYRK